MELKRFDQLQDENDTNDTNGNAEATRSRNLGSRISLAYRTSLTTRSAKITNDIDIDSDNENVGALTSLTSLTSMSIPITYDQMGNIRNSFYLNIVHRDNAKDLLLNKIKYVVSGLEADGDLKPYNPSEQQPIYVFKNSEIIATITNSIATIGNLSWNTIVGSSHIGVSRIHAVIVFMKNTNDEIVMIVIDAWSMFGTALLDNKGNEIEVSSGNSRKVLIAEIEDCASITFANDKYTFSTNAGKTCVVCLERMREVRYECGHGVVCVECNKGINTCPICRVDIDKTKNKQSMCHKTFVVK